MNAAVIEEIKRRIAVLSEYAANQEREAKAARSTAEAYEKSGRQYRDEIDAWGIALMAVEAHPAPPLTPAGM